MHDMRSTGLKQIVGADKCLICFERIEPRGKLLYAQTNWMTISVDGHKDIVETMRDAGIDVRAVNTHRNRHTHGYDDLLGATAEDLLFS